MLRWNGRPLFTSRMSLLKGQTRACSLLERRCLRVCSLWEVGYTWRCSSRQRSGAATHPGVEGGTHRRRATFERCEVFVGGVRLGFGVLFLSCVCVSVSGVLFSVGVCVCDLLIFSHGGASISGSRCPVRPIHRGSFFIIKLYELLWCYDSSWTTVSVLTRSIACSELFRFRG